MPHDIEITNHGTIFLVRPMNERAEQWLLNNTDAISFNGSIAVEHCFIAPLLDLMTEDGLEVLPL